VSKDKVDQQAQNDNQLGSEESNQQHPPVLPKERLEFAGRGALRFIACAVLDISGIGALLDVVVRHGDLHAQDCCSVP
jgi:hypothetical protein